MSAGRKALLAELFEVVEAETPYGGRSVTYETVGSVWLKPGAVRQRQRAEGGTSATIETVTAEVRVDSRLVTERRLQFGGADWRIASSDTVGGRTILNLERMR